jgi:DDE superfamily endonuclease
VDKNFERFVTGITVRTGKKNASEWEWVQEILNEFELVVDSYEQPIERPSDYQEQKKYYSGKQKRHTLKNQLIVMPSGQEIVDVEVGETGATVDIKIWRSRQTEFSDSQRFQGDKAYVGEPQIDAPHKKTRSQDITPAQKKENLSIALWLYIANLLFKSR